MKKLATLNRTNTPKDKLPERIIQFGEGNFLRAFADWMVAKMNKEIGFDSSIVIVKPRQHGSLQKFKDQDCLYHINVQGLNQEGQAIDTIELVDSISRCINPYEEYDEFISLAELPEIRFVFSNTTEAGITYVPECKLNDKPALSYPAKLTQLLYRRYQTFNGDKTKGLIILPCELISHNGNNLKNCIDKHIEDWKSELSDDYEGFKNWFNEYNYICNTLVDRIVTGHPKQGQDDLFERIGYIDSLLVQCEYYHFWAIEPPKHISFDQIETEFPANHIGLNVLYTEDESIYHERKLTLLNAPHTVLSPVAFLYGIDIVREACKDCIVGRYVKKVMEEELLPTLNTDTTELHAFASDIRKRFLNPYIDHQLTSIMLNSFSKFKARDLKALLCYKDKFGKLPKCIVLGLAAIIVYYKGGTRKDGTILSPNDSPEIVNLLNNLWSKCETKDVVSGVLKAADQIWGEYGDLTKIEGLAEMLTNQVTSIQNAGMRATIESIL